MRVRWATALGLPPSYYSRFSIATCGVNRIIFNEPFANAHSALQLLYVVSRDSKWPANLLIKHRPNLYYFYQYDALMSFPVNFK